MSEDKKIHASVWIRCRSIPTLLNDMIARDGDMGVIKDGIRSSTRDDLRIPRFTVMVYSNNDNKNRTLKLLMLLRDLSANNQIFDFITKFHY